jgi:hypothetical protein
VVHIFICPEPNFHDLPRHGQVTVHALYYGWGHGVSHCWGLLLFHQASNINHRLYCRNITQVLAAMADGLML